MKEKKYYIMRQSWPNGWSIETLKKKFRNKASNNHLVNSLNFKSIQWHFNEWRGILPVSVYNYLAEKFFQAQLCTEGVAQVDGAIEQLLSQELVVGLLFFFIHVTDREHCWTPFSKVTQPRMDVQQPALMANITKFLELAINMIQPSSTTQLVI